MNNDKPPKALPHQKEGSNFLASRKAGALFDEQGLGKTKQLIDAVSASVSSGAIQGAVIVCPNTLKATWRDEIAKHAPDARVVVLGAGKAARRQALGNLRGMFYVVNYEAIPLEGVVLRALLRFKRFALVLDESHRIKNPSAAVTQMIHDLKQHAARRYILSGTPVANTPDDLWSQLNFLDDGAVSGASPDEFRQKFGDSEIGYKNLERLSGELASIGLRRTKEKNLKLPKKSVIRIKAPLSPMQAAMYDGLRKKTRTWVSGLSSKEVARQSDNILTKLLRLVEIASNPRLVDHSYHETPGKFAVVDKLLKDRLEESSNKVILWTSFVENVEDLKRRYARYNPVVIHGAISAQQRASHVRRFRTDPKTQLLIANPAAAREGLTLIEARTAIYLDRTFNLVDYLQSQDRIHRIGQTKECEIILLIAPETIDEYLDFSIEQKARVARFVQGDASRVQDGDLKLKKPAVLKALLS